MSECAECGREFFPRQSWIHEPVCRYMNDVEPNHVKEEGRGPLRVTEAVTEGSSVTVPPAGVTRLTSNAERQRRYRERQRGARS
jgi:hypothetical protein